MYDPTRLAARSTLAEAERVENRYFPSPLRGGGRGVGFLNLAGNEPFLVR
jgi:hypothetical protein